MNNLSALERRAFLRAAALAGTGAGMVSVTPAWAQPLSRGLVRPLPTLTGADIALNIGEVTVRVDGRPSRAIGINGTSPAPLIRLKEGQKVRLRVRNDLNEESSLHWHGLLVPFAMDGVPGVSFPGISPRSTFDYEFEVIQNGTYWYHGHSGFQEVDGLLGPIIIDPAGPDPIAYDREHVLVLSDENRMSGATIFKKLKQMGGYFNMQRTTLSGQLSGRDDSGTERREWAAMRMDPTDISDVTGSAGTFTINGYGPFDNWTALFRPGERVRLRVINAASQNAFNVRIPGLPITVVQADGQNVRPVTVDELQIAVAETYDLIVTPGDRAYSFVAEAVDRSGLGRATLAPREGMIAPVPPLRARPLLTMKDMGMGDMGHGAMDMTGARRGIDPSAEQNASKDLWKLTGWTATGDQPSPTAATSANGAMDHGSMSMRDFANAPQVNKNPGVQTISPMPVDRTGEPGLGLDNVGHKVLTYRDLMALDRNPDVRAPSRTLDIHLTGNMERYMWSFDGVKLSEPAAPLPFRLDERVRVRLINDTMMQHPIHLHGHFFELVTGHGAYAPRKHTVNVAPGGIVTFDVTTDAAGDWAFHCHNLFHMAAGMMRIVTIRGEGDSHHAAS